MNKKELIIETATRLFSEYGYENTPISKICNIADVSKGLVFHHFKSKDHLLCEIYKRTTDLIYSIIKSSFNKESKLESLLYFINNFLTNLESYQNDYRFNIYVMIQPNTKQILSEQIDDRTKMVIKYVQKLFEGIDADNIEATYMLIAELDGIALNYISINNYPLNLIKQSLLNRYSNKYKL